MRQGGVANAGREMEEKCSGYPGGACAFKVVGETADVPKASGTFLVLLPFPLSVDSQREELWVIARGSHTQNS